MKDFRNQAWLPWAAIGVLAGLCGFLAFLQYRWIGDIADAERTRLRGALQVHLGTLSRALNDEFSSAANALIPAPALIDQQGAEAAYSAQYVRWRETHDRLFQRIGIALPANGDLRLFVLDFN